VSGTTEPVVLEPAVLFEQRYAFGSNMAIVINRYNSPMIRALTSFAIVLLLAGVPALAQRGQPQQQPGPVDITGDWSLYMSLDDGPEEHWNMGILQNGTALKGTIVNERGDFDFKGTINGRQVKMTWELPYSGRMLQMTFVVSVEGAQGNQFKGRVTMGDLGEGPVEAVRTAK